VYPRARASRRRRSITTASSASLAKGPDDE
jgi:hypothetical protein